MVWMTQPWKKTVQEQLPPSCTGGGTKVPWVNSHNCWTQALGRRGFAWCFFGFFWWGNISVSLFFPIAWISLIRKLGWIAQDVWSVLEWRIPLVDLFFHHKGFKLLLRSAQLCRWLALHDTTRVPQTQPHTQLGIYTIEDLRVKGMDKCPGSQETKVSSPPIPVHKQPHDERRSLWA